MKLFDLSGKVAIITGSSRGIGRAIAEAFAEAGGRVVISARNAEPCEEVAAAIRANGGEAMAVTARISDQVQLENLVAKTREAWGRIDILVCNAAINPHYGSLEQLTDAVFERMMVNNVLSMDQNRSSSSARRDCGPFASTHSGMRSMSGTGNGTAPSR
jgi:dehydrogenase/reductase SDR family member 4